MNEPPDGCDPIALTKIVTPQEAQCLATAGFHTTRQLLDWFPRRHEDRRRFDAFPVAPGNGPVCVHGTVIDTRHRSGQRMRFYEAIVADTSSSGLGPATLTCRWFNMPWLGNLLASGQEVVVYGTPKEYKGTIFLDHPEFEIVQPDSGLSIHFDRIVPVYRNISGISQRRLREIIHAALALTPPASLTPALELDSALSRARAYQNIHFPESSEQALEARRHFALEEFFAIQLNVVWRRQHVLTSRGRSLGKKTTLLTALYHSLPFDLTHAQKRSIREIATDMRTPRPMHRLLQGDVGSGKTFVAMAAMLLAVDSGVQAALMAPTQILAEQHFLTFRRWLAPLGVRVCLRTAARRIDSHLEPEDAPQIAIGTHALFHDVELFSNLGLVVIDEQHKFGVLQRARLISRGLHPDVLVMTATPIPRTLTMTIYGDLDVSVLDERPAGRGKLVTAVREKPRQTDVTKFVKDQLDSGRQVYLVYPLVEESENLSAEAATTAAEKWRKRLPGHEVGLLHGKLDAEAKEEIMRRFREGEIHALVATSVIEVGVDVPNANTMVIHHADRFGLAQLHQLRGRIGRGEHKSYCILLNDAKSPAAMEKLEVLSRSPDGFVIAEEDLRLRGPGDVLGTMQSGLGKLRFPEFLADIPLLRHARALADEILAADPTLSDKYAPLRALIHTQEPPASHA